MMFCKNVLMNEQTRMNGGEKLISGLANFTLSHMHLSLARRPIIFIPPSVTSVNSATRYYYDQFSHKISFRVFHTIILHLSVQTNARTNEKCRRYGYKPLGPDEREMLISSRWGVNLNWRAWLPVR